MLLNIRNTQFNWFDNPYVSPNVYHLDSDWKPKLSRDIKLKRCEVADLLKFMSKSLTSWYPNALCFDDKNKIKIKGNWY